MINKDMTVGEVLRSCSDAAMDAVVKIFTDMGMHCLFCPHSTAETLEEAAMVHGNDVDELVAKLNTVFHRRPACRQRAHHRRSGQRDQRLGGFDRRGY